MRRRRRWRWRWRLQHSLQQCSIRFSSAAFAAAVQHWARTFSQQTPPMQQCSGESLTFSHRMPPVQYINTFLPSILPLSICVSTQLGNSPDTLTPS
jgi:hypothetical protein